MTTATKPRTVRARLLDICVEELEKARHDKGAAAAAIKIRAHQDSRLWKELTEHLIDQGIWDAIRKADSNSRLEIHHSHDDASGLESLAADAKSKLLLDFPMMSGKLLRFSTRPELLAEAATRTTWADKHRFVARWITLVATELPSDDIPVGEVLDEAATSVLYEQADG